MSAPCLRLYAATSRVGVMRLGQVPANVPAINVPKLGFIIIVTPPSKILGGRPAAHSGRSAWRYVIVATVTCVATGTSRMPPRIVRHQAHGMLCLERHLASCHFFLARPPGDPAHSLQALGFFALPRLNFASRREPYSLSCLYYPIYHARCQPEIFSGQSTIASGFPPIRQPPEMAYPPNISF